MVFPRALRPERRWGLGVRHALFPRTLTFGAQLHPSSIAGCQFPDATLVCMDDCNPLRLRSGTGLRCHHRGHLGEASQPGLHTLAGVLPPNPAWTLLSFSASSPLPQGRHPALAGSLALRHGSCLLTLLLHFPSQAGDPVFGASRASDLIALPRSYRPPGTFLRIAQSVMIRSLFTPRLRHRDAVAAFCIRPEPPDCVSPHWLVVATTRSLGTDYVHPRIRNPGSRGVTRLRGWFPRPAPLLWSRHGSIPLTA